MISVGPVGALMLDPFYARNQVSFGWGIFSGSGLV